MSAYKPHEFWERSHSHVSPDDVKLGFGIHHVGGGQSDSEAAAMYQLRRINANRVFRKCALPPNPKIFELGSGGGYWVEFFRRFKPSAFVGSDLSGTAVERLFSLHPDYQFITMEPPDHAWSRIESLGPYDLSLAIDVLYHITDDNVWANTLNNLCANTAASGLLLIADYFYEQPTDKPSTVHVKFRPMQAYLNLLDQNGFSAEQVQPVFYFMNRIVSGPWRDHNKLFSPVLHFLASNSAGLTLIRWVDAAVTAFLRPMNPRCKTRFLLARKAAGI
jgi:hypothetical protein